MNYAIAHPVQLKTVEEIGAALDDDPFLSLCLMHGHPAPVTWREYLCYITDEGRAYIVRTEMVTVLRAMVMRDLENWMARHFPQEKPR